MRFPFLIEPGRELSISLTSETKRGRQLISLTVRGIGPAVELINSTFIRITCPTHGHLMNLPPDTARRALYTSRINSPIRKTDKKKYHHAPIWQLAPGIRGRLEVIIKFIDRATYVYNWKLPRRVGGTAEAAKLSEPSSAIID